MGTITTSVASVIAFISGWLLSYWKFKHDEKEAKARRRQVAAEKRTSLLDTFTKAMIAIEKRELEWEKLAECCPACDKLDTKKQADILLRQSAACFLIRMEMDKPTRDVEDPTAIEHLTTWVNDVLMRAAEMKSPFEVEPCLECPSRPQRPWLGCPSKPQ